MKLSVYSRIVLLNNLPPQGDITSIRIVRVLREELSLSEDEHKLVNLQIDEETQNLTWNPQLDPMKDIEIGERAMEIIKETVKKFTKFSEERETMNSQNLEVIEQFLSVEEIDKIVVEVKEAKAKERDKEKAEKEKQK